MLERSSNDGKVDSSSVESNALNSLRLEIAAHEKQSQSRSYLGKVSDFIYRSDDKSLAAMETLKSDIEQANKAGDKAKVAELSKQASGIIQDDRSKRGLQDEISHYSAGFVKTAAIFARGRLGLWGAVGAYALDAMSPSTDFRSQLTDGALGGLKGGLLKSTFDFLGSKQVGIAAQGVALGTSSRLLEFGLSRKTYEGANGQFDLVGGLGNTVRGTLDRKALVSDVVVFGLAHGLLSKTNSLTGGMVDKSAMLRTVLTGTTFGLSMGSVNEIQRQAAAGESFDLGKVVRRSLLQGAIDTVAAGPGGMQARSAAARRSAEAAGSGEPIGDRANLLSRSDRVSDKPREFVVLEGQEALAKLGAGTETAGWMRVREILGKGGEAPLGPIKSLFVQHLGKGQSINEGAAKSADLVACCHPETMPADVRGKHVLPEGSGSVWLTPDRSNSRIAFTQGTRPKDVGESFKPSEAIELRPHKTVKKVLEEQGHGDLAELLSKHAKLFSSLDALTVIGQGNESVAVELAPSKTYPDGAVLKITIPECGWEAGWGKRSFDAELLSKVRELDMEGAGTAYAYVQELVTTMERYDPVMLDKFMTKLADTGMEFQDPGAVPTKQIGVSDRTGELVLIDYSAVDRPGANETHQTIIGGAERVEAQYEAENRPDFKEPTESIESVYQSVVDGGLEARRQEVLADPRLLPHQRSILQELFEGSTLQDAALLRAVELGKMTAKGEIDMIQALAEAKELHDSARKHGLLPR